MEQALAMTTSARALDLNALQLFVTIVDAGSQSVAARQLNMTRSNLSYRLKALESALGAQLLHRSTRQMVLTEVGAGVYQHGLNILREAAAAQALASDASIVCHGHVRLSVPAGLGLSVLTSRLADFRRQHPGITLELVFSNQITNLVAHGIDIALRLASRPPASAASEKLADVHWTACALPAYLEAAPPVRVLEDLARHPVLCAAATGQTLKLTGRYASGQRHVMLDPAVRSDDFFFLTYATQLGMGIGLLPRYLVQQPLQTGALRAVLADYDLRLFGAHLYLLTNPTRYQTQATRALVDCLRAHIRNDTLYGPVAASGAPPALMH